VSIRLGLALVVFALDLWALSQLFAQPRPRRQRLRWAFAIVFLPLLGILLWRRDSNRRWRSRLEQRL